MVATRIADTHTSDRATHDDGTPRHWWESRLTVALAIALAAVPLIYPAIPPLVDLLGHMGRYRGELGLESSPWLQR